MPVVIKKSKTCKNRFMVLTYPNGLNKKPKIKSYCTSLKKAKSQKRLLDAIDHGYLRIK